MQKKTGRRQKYFKIEQKENFTFKSAVMANIATFRFGSVIKFSKSTLHGETQVGCVMASRLKARTAANFNVGFDEPRKNCNTEWKFKSSRDMEIIYLKMRRRNGVHVPEIAGKSSFTVTPLREQIAFAASKLTISKRCRKQLSM